MKAFLSIRPVVDRFIKKNLALQKKNSLMVCRSRIPALVGVIMINVVYYRSDLSLLNESFNVFL